MTPVDLEEALIDYVFRFTNERELQDGVAGALFSEGISFDREHSLSQAGRPDFWLMDFGIAVEVKVDGSANEVNRQLMRYAEHDEVKGLLLVTSRAKHLNCADPPRRMLGGKPVGVLCVVEV